MALLIKAILVFVLSNFPLTFFVIGLLAAVIGLWRAGRPDGGMVLEKLIAWHVFWAIGVSFLYNAVVHIAFGRMAAAFIGWADSPFQFEVGTASLGFAAVGFLAAFRSFDLRLAAVTGPGIFTLGAAIGHIRQMIVMHDFAAGNAGVIFYMDIAIPAFGWCVLALQHRRRER
ncbi:hypothetical protein AcidC75_19930 [Acidisoma sp. C75]